MSQIDDNWEEKAINVNSESKIVYTFDLPQLFWNRLNIQHCIVTGKHSKTGHFKLDDSELIVKLT